jgi:hypothetical protein
MLKENRQSMGEYQYLKYIIPEFPRDSAKKRVARDELVSLKTGRYNSSAGNPAIGQS